MNRIWLQLFPFLEWWREVSRATLRGDLAAGLTGAVVVLPQGVAFATIAGMPPQYGLYSAMIPTVIAALYGSSRHLVSGPNTAASIVLFTSLSALAAPGTDAFVTYALTLTLMVGVIELALGIARLGALVNFISHSVIVGFTAGAGVLIATHQLHHFFGVEMPRGLSFHEVLVYLYLHLGAIDPFTMLVGVVTLATSILCKMRLPRVPYMLVALAVGSVVAAALNYLLYTRHGLAQAIALVGDVPVGLPPLSHPDLSIATIKSLAPVALGVTLFSLTVSVTLSRSIATRSGQYIDGNQESIGQGLANLLGSFFSGYVVTGSFNRSGLNFDSGAQTPLAAMLSGAALVVIVLGVGPLLAHLPYAAMAAVLFLVAWGIVDFKSIARIGRTSRSETLVMAITFVATLFLELEFAIVLGVFASLVHYLRKAAQPQVLVRMPDPRKPKRRFNTDAALAECPQLCIVRIDGSLFYGSVQYVAERLRVIGKRNPEQNHLLIFARGINTIDVAGVDLLAREREARRGAGGEVYFHWLKDPALRILERSAEFGDLAAERVYYSKTEAVAGIFDRLDRDVCMRCDKRIFRECQSVPSAPAKRGESGNRR